VPRRIRDRPRRVSPVTPPTGLEHPVTASLALPPTPRLPVPRERLLRLLAGLADAGAAAEVPAARPVRIPR
jgi:hypothetical protein